MSPPPTRPAALPRYVALLVFVATSVAAQITLPDMIVRATRQSAARNQMPFTVTRLGPELRTAPAATLDGALRGVPGFSLFRRSDSLSANPTAQGVSLRGLGPSGASRSLVLLDGVPLNDPFGGWVAWSKVPRESLAGAELVRGGGATAWGNAALGGIVQLLTEAPDHPRGRLAAGYGGFATHQAEFSINQPAGDSTWQLLGRDFATDGFPLVAPEDRGPIDRSAASEHRWLTGRWERPLTPDLSVRITARTYREERNNGTPYQHNDSQEEFVSVDLLGRRDRHFTWRAVAYAQDQRFASTFSAVNAPRTAETPASDQFAVPATAVGATWTGAWNHDEKSLTSAGLDYRRVRGETRENFSFSAGDFTRQRRAGGTQELAGAFVQHERPLTGRLRATLGGRLDYWREQDGHRLETDRATGNVLRHEAYAGRDGFEFSPGAGLVWAAAGWQARVAAQHSFRRPTLNELHRPFRVGNVITEANAALETEHATSAEIGLEYAHPGFTLGGVLFWNDLRDAVGNVTLFRGPGTFPIVGFVPAGGAGRQRLNLDRLRVQGLELSAKWRLAAGFTVTADYLRSDATVRATALAPGLIGKQLAQVPRHSAALGAEWRTGRLTFAPRLRLIGRQFEDDENQLVLGAAAIADLGASYRLRPGGDLFVTVENLGDTRLETGRSPDGLVNTGTPRLVLGGFRATW